MGDEPGETHTYRDRDGNPCAMADAWSTVVEREPEYDEHGQAEILALMAWESRCCPACGNYMTVVSQGAAERNVTSADGRTFSVQMHRCLPCGLEEVVRREWHEAHKDDKPNAAGALASDGLIFVARPQEED